VELGEILSFNVQRNGQIFVKPKLPITREMFESKAFQDHMSFIRRKVVPVIIEEVNTWK